MSFGLPLHWFETTPDWRTAPVSCSVHRKLRDVTTYSAFIICIIISEPMHHHIDTYLENLLSVDYARAGIKRW